MYISHREDRVLHSCCCIYRENHQEHWGFSGDITVGSMSSLCACCFMVNSSAHFQALLGRGWIHANQCITSSMRQLLLFWKWNDVEIAEADTQPFQASASTVEARYYNGYFGPIKVRSENMKGSPVYMQTPTPSPVLEIIINPTIIVPSRSIIHPVIEEIDDWLQSKIQRDRRNILYVKDVWAASSG